MNHFRSSVVAMLFATGLVFAARAQTPELTETFAGDGWTISHPAGWIVNVQALPALATDEAALATMQRNAPLPDGGITIGIIPPGLYGALGVTPTASAAETMDLVAAVFGGEGTVEPFEGTPYVAFARDLVGTTRVPPMTKLITAEVDGEVVTFLVVAEDFAAVTPLIQAIVGSFTTP
ncbi:MAG: hypothetical protein AB7U48_11460 [Bauldia sp.]